ncbi:MAG: hypothetical protein KDD58_03275 [Bdellovibrionales bacterium]|nr:hypothetical protein [Bdellovibrionales bacterium]
MKFDEFKLQRGKIQIAPVLDRLMEMVNRRYGCELSYRVLDELADEDKKILCGLDPKGPALRQGSRALFPIAVKGDVMGMAEVSKSEQIHDRSLRAMQEVISMVIESLHLTANNLEIVQFLEKQLEQKPKSDSKVVSLVHYKTEQGIKTHYTWNKSFSGKTTFNVPCLIEAKNSLDIHKMSLEVHEHSRRYAFLFFNQLDKKVRLNPIEWHALGNISLFIPDISSIKDEELFSLTSFLKSSRTKESPQIIAGSLLPIKDIYKNQLIPKEVINLLSVAFLRLENSFEFYKNQGLIKFFFDSLHNNTSLV